VALVVVAVQPVVVHMPPVHGLLVFVKSVQVARLAPRVVVSLAVPACSVVVMAVVLMLRAAVPDAFCTWKAVVEFAEFSKVAAPLTPEIVATVAKLFRPVPLVALGLAIWKVMLPPLPVPVPIPPFKVRVVPATFVPEALPP
jgi:hypothetical protein